MAHGVRQVRELWGGSADRGVNPEERPDDDVILTSLRRMGFDEDVDVDMRGFARPRSTVFVVRARARATDREVTLFHKRSHQTTTSTMTPSWEQAATLQQEAADRLAAIGVVVPRIVYADPGTGVSVSTAVPGRQLERWLRRNPLARRAPLLGMLTTIGRALRSIAEVGAGASPDGHALWPDLERRLSAATLLDAEDRARVRTRMQELWEAASSEPGAFSYVHGDVSVTNVLVARRSVGLVDFGWPSRLHAYDLVKFAHRLEAIASRGTHAPDRCVEALLDGYGPEVRDTAAFQYLDVQQLVRRLAVRANTKQKERLRVKAYARLTEALR